MTLFTFYNRNFSWLKFSSDDFSSKFSYNPDKLVNYGI